jgi:CHAT domain-containing protein
LKRALTALERYFGPDHLYLSKCHKALEMACNRLRRPSEEAYEHIRRAVSIHERMGGKDQLELVTLLCEKSALEIVLNRWDEAVATAVRAVEAGLDVQEESYQVYSTTEAVMLAYAPGAAAGACINAVAANPNCTDSTLARVFSYVFKTHGMVLDRLVERQQFLESVDESVRVDLLWRDLAAATQRTADLVIRGPGDSPAIYRSELASAYRREEAAERALAEASDRLRALAPVPVVDRTKSTDALAAVLGRNAELIHFVRFKKCQLFNDTAEGLFHCHYGAFHLKGGETDHCDLAFVDLGPRASVDSLIFDYRRAVDAVEPGRRPSAREENEYQNAARRLYERVWAPFMSRDRDVARAAVPSDSLATVFLVLESWFHLLDFNALIAPTGDAVIERYKLHRLSSAGDLMRLSRTPPAGVGLLAVGSPVHFTGDTIHDEGTSPRGLRSSPVLCPEAYSPPVPLPGAEREVQAVASLFPEGTGEPVSVLLGREATEEAVKRLLPGNRIVHLATHGFFCEEGSSGGYPSAERLANPLLMSGLVLVPSKGDDGLLTAQELSCIDMRGLEWVVLSACRSGLGRLFWGEGLFGLPRAFEMAGARTVVMTLWKIDDIAMRDIMERLYRYRLSGCSTVDAIRRAQLERLREQRRRLNRIHPVLWGGVIAEGDWR